MPSDRNGGAGACVGEVVGFVVVVVGGSVDVVVGGTVVGGAVDAVVGGRVVVEVVVVAEVVVVVVVDVVADVVVVVVVILTVADVVVDGVGVVDAGDVLPQAVRSTAAVASTASPVHSRLLLNEHGVYCVIRIPLFETCGNIWIQYSIFVRFRQDMRAGYFGSGDSL